MTATFLPASAAPAPTPTLERALDAYNKGDDDTAFAMFTALAEQDNVKAIEMLADMYYYGEGTAKDNLAGFRWSERGAALGSSEAEYDIALSYLNGEIGPADNAKALEWLHRSAGHGGEKAQQTLAGFQLIGELIPRDEAAAVITLRRLAGKGREYAQLNLGLWLVFNPLNKDRNIREGLHWTALAAEQRFRPALQLMGVATQLGLDGPPDALLAAMWYKLSAQQGCLAGVAAYNSVSAAFSPGQREDVLAMVKAWDTAHPARPLHDHNQFGAAAGPCAPNGAQVDG